MCSLRYVDPRSQGVACVPSGLGIWKESLHMSHDLIVALLPGLSQLISSFVTFVSKLPLPPSFLPPALFSE